LASNLADGPHEVRIARRNEGHGGTTTFIGFAFADGVALPPPRRPERRLQFIGDSITCGYGSEGKSPCPYEFWSENYEVTYAALTARHFGAEAHVIAKSGWGMWRGADGRSYGVIPRIYDRQLPEAPLPVWAHDTFVPDAIVINLSTNDFGKGDPGVYLTQAYAEFLERLRGLYPRAYLLATSSPMLGGSAKLRSSEHIRLAIERRVQAGDTGVDFLEFETQHLGDQLGCNSHPGKTTHAKMAAVLEAKLADRLQWTAAANRTPAAAGAAPP
jgi:lysophospholipase L1-like esterase